MNASSGGVTENFPLAIPPLLIAESNKGHKKGHTKQVKIFSYKLSHLWLSSSEPLHPQYASVTFIDLCGFAKGGHKENAKKPGF